MAMSKEQLAEELALRLSSSTPVRCDEPLAKKTTLRVGGPADFYVEPASESDLAQILQFCSEKDFPFFLLGRGSNLLIKDSGIRGFVVSLGHFSFSEIKFDGDLLRCGAGAKLKAISVEARKNNLSRLEFLEGIPGSLGGALRMNAGAMGAAMFNVVESIRIMDCAGHIQELKRSGLEVEYRNCSLLKSHVALSAVLKGSPEPGEMVAERMRTYSAKRWASQPKEPSAGCIFKNPETISAGKLIEELGLKGIRIGSARVSEVHGNFIVNDGAASAADVLNLIELIKSRAKEVRGLDLRTEVEIVGE
ncbi:MAG: UDP-N-acetylmuramate dehydrogenase [Verrucomicrobiota bacterium]